LQFLEKYYEEYKQALEKHASLKLLKATLQDLKEEFDKEMPRAFLRVSCLMIREVIETYEGRH